MHAKFKNDQTNITKYRQENPNEVFDLVSLENSTPFAKDFDMNKFFGRIFLGFLYLLQRPTLSLRWETAHAYHQNPRKKVYSYRNPWQKVCNQCILIFLIECEIALGFKF